MSESKSESAEARSGNDTDPALIRREELSFACLLQGKPPLGSEKRLEGDMRRAWYSRDD